MECLPDVVFMNAALILLTIDWITLRCKERPIIGKPKLHEAPFIRLIIRVVKQDKPIWSDKLGKCRSRHECSPLLALHMAEKELAVKASRFLKAEMKRAGVTYAELARRMKEHGLEETEASITSKLARGTFAATFLLAVMAALEIGELRLDSL